MLRGGSANLTAGTGAEVWVTPRRCAGKDCTACAVKAHFLLQLDPFPLWLSALLKTTRAGCGAVTSFRQEAILMLLPVPSLLFPEVLLLSVLPLLTLLVPSWKVLTWR